MSDYLQDSIFNYQPKDDIVQNKNDKQSSFVFSYSKMSLYNECPLKYKFKYIDKIPEKPKKFFFIGRVIHSTLEFFFSHVPPPSFEEITKFAINQWEQTSWQDKGYALEEYEKIDLQKIINILKNFYFKHSDNKKLPFLLEYSTYVTINGYKFTIIADKIEYLGNGKITIIDYKTGKEGDRTPQQLYFYQKVCEADPTIIKKIQEKYSENISYVEVESMIYYYVENLKEIKYPRAKNSEIDKFWDEAISTIENILSNKFYPNPSEKSCRWCDYKSICEVYKIKNTDKINQLFEEYLKINNEIEKLKIQLEQIGNELINEMKKEKKILITNGKKTLKIEKKPKIEDILNNREEIKQILKDFGIYEKLTKLTATSIIELLEDPKTPKELIDKLLKFITEEDKIFIKDNFK
ncbi:MAG: PD-(D/E)XK nuclease family protein [Elusimicrobiales bacterium]|nr:PD-(D/E)XK nuclease family protein [Elusimicrobiales bacterium]